MRYRIWKFEKKNCLIFLNLTKQFFCNCIRNPIISQVVLCDALVIFDDRYEFFLDFLFNHIANILFVVQNVHLHIRNIQFFEFLSAVIYSS